MQKEDHHYFNKLTQKDWGERQQTLTTVFCTIHLARRIRGEHA